MAKKKALAAPSWTMVKKATGKKRTKKDQTANLGFEAKLWLAADKLRNNMDAGSAIPPTSRDDFYSICVSVPPNELLVAVVRVLAPLYSKQSANEHETLALSALRDMLLPNPLSGELRVPAALTPTEEVLA